MVPPADSPHARGAEGQEVGAIADRDPAVIAGSVLFATFFFVLANLLVDLSYAWVDPRVRLGE